MDNVVSVVSASEGVKTAPAATTLMADTGAITVLPGNLNVAELHVVVSAENGATLAAVDIQHRNAANSATLEDMRVYVLAETTITIPFVVGLATGERIRAVVVVTPGTGDDLQVLITGVIRSV